MSSDPRQSTSEPQSFRVTVVQTEPTFGDVDSNRLRTVEAVREHAESDLIVLPELATSGYVFQSDAEVDRVAEPVDGPTAAAWTDVAAETDTWIVGGFPEHTDGGRYNAAMLVSPDGVEGVYRKAHLWDEERRWFTAGDDLPVFETPFGRIGIQICNDLWFPEATITQARQGADLIAVPTNWVPGGTEGGRPGGWTMGLHQAAAHANSNRVYVACADRVGTERGVEFMGQSAVLTPAGIPAAGPASATNTGVVTASYAPAIAREKALTENDDVLADRRPAIYDLGE